MYFEHFLVLHLSSLLSNRDSFFSSLSKNINLQPFIINFIFQNNFLNNNNELLFQILKNIAPNIFDNVIAELIKKNIINDHYKKNYNISINRILDILEINTKILI